MVRGKPHRRRDVRGRVAQVDRVARRETRAERARVQQDAEPRPLAGFTRDRRVSGQHVFGEVRRVLAAERRRHEVRDAGGAVATEPPAVVHLEGEGDREQSALGRVGAGAGDQALERVRALQRVAAADARDAQAREEPGGVAAVDRLRRELPPRGVDGPVVGRSAGKSAEERGEVRDDGEHESERDVNERRDRDQHRGGGEGRAHPRR